MKRKSTHQEASAANTLTNELRQLDNHHSSNSCVWQYCTGGTELALFPGSPHVQTKIEVRVRVRACFSVLQVMKSWEGLGTWPVLNASVSSSIALQ